MNKKDRKKQKRRRREQRNKDRLVKAKSVRQNAYRKALAAAKNTESKPVDWSEWPAVKAVCDRMQSKLERHGLRLDNQIVGGSAIDALLRATLEGEQHPFSEWQQWEIEDAILELTRCIESVPKRLADQMPCLPYWYLGGLFKEGDARDRENEWMSSKLAACIAEIWHDLQKKELAHAKRVWEFGQTIAEIVARGGGIEEISPDIELGQRALLFFNSWSSPESYIDASPRIRWCRFLYGGENEDFDYEVLAPFRQWLSFVWGDEGADRQIRAIIDGTKDRNRPPGVNLNRLNARFKKILDEPEE